MFNFGDISDIDEFIEEMKKHELWLMENIIDL